MITLERVTAPRKRPAVRDISLAWGPGVHALVGAAADGGPLLLSVIGGTVAPGAGTVRVLEGEPTDGAIRERVAHVSLQPALPEALRVREVLELASTLRREAGRDPVERLATLGIEALAPRLVRSLSKQEARAVALAEGLTSARVRVLLVEEPFVAVDARVAAGLAAAVRARARDACTVVIATASPRDAADLADDHVLLERGAIVGRAPSLELLSGFAAPGARLRIVTHQPQALLAELARQPGVEAIGRRDGAVVARGADALELARAAGRAVLDSGADVVELRFQPPTLEDARSASAGVARATYEAAYARTRATLTPPAGGGEPGIAR